jgi:predicted transcriptional regulator
MEQIRWIDHVKDEVLYRVEEGRNILGAINKKDVLQDLSQLAHEPPSKTRY